MRNTGLDEAQAEIKIAGRNINNLRYADDTTLIAESKEELKSALMKVKQESEKAGLKLNIQKTKIMTSGPTPHIQLDKACSQQWRSSTDKNNYFKKGKKRELSLWPEYIGQPILKTLTFKSVTFPSYKDKKLQNKE